MNRSTRLRSVLVVLIGVWCLGGNASIASGDQNSPQVFPIGLYCVNSSSPYSNNVTREFPDIAAAGFNVIQSYQFEGDLNGPANTIEDARSYLDAAYKSGLKVLMGVPQECVSKRNLPCIKKRVSALKDHRALFGWQLYDEPDTPAYDLHGKEQGPAVPSKNLVEAYKTIKQHQGRTYLLTVNPSRGPVQLQIRFALDRFPNPRITLLPEGQRIPFQSGSFNAQWSPYDVRIYEIVSGRP